MSQRVAGRYTLVQTLGGGGTSVVHRAQIAGGAEVAVKQLRPHFAADPALRRRFLREAELARTLDDPGIVRVLDAGEDGGVPFLVLELMRGETLRSRLQRDVRLPADVARAIFLALGGALAHAHDRGVIHRDVKPENVFLTADGVKLGDFGNARVVSLASVTGASLAWGTPEYVAPEVFMRGRADPRSDLYSLGVVLHEMLAGRLPWSRSETLSRLAGHARSTVSPLEEVGGEVNTLLADLLAFSAAARPASVEEVVARLSHPVEGATAVISRCPACGERRPNDVPRCLACGHEVPRFARDPEGRWQLVLEKLDDDPAATARLLSLLDPIAEHSERSLQFLTGHRNLYSPEEIKSGIALPAVLFAGVGEETARALESLFRRDGLDVHAVKGRPLGRKILATIGATNPRQLAALSLPLLAMVVLAARGPGAAFARLVGGLSVALLTVLTAAGVAWWRKRQAIPAPESVFALREAVVSGPVAEALLASTAATMSAVRAPEVRALLGDVATELYRLTRRAEQLGARSAEPSSEAELLRRTADAAPPLLERLRRMATRLDDLDAALEGQTEGELMQALARLERGAAIPGADRAALAAARRDVEANLERRHAAEQERARLSARLCQLLGHLRVVYRQTLMLQTPADEEARLFEAASAELDALLVASA